MSAQSPIDEKDKQLREALRKHSNYESAAEELRKKKAEILSGDKTFLITEDLRKPLSRNLTITYKDASFIQTVPLTIAKGQYHFRMGNKFIKTDNIKDIEKIIKEQQKSQNEKKIKVEAKIVSTPPVNPKLETLKDSITTFLNKNKIKTFFNEDFSIQYVTGTSTTPNTYQVRIEGGMSDELTLQTLQTALKNHTPSITATIYYHGWPAIPFLAIPEDTDPKIFQNPNFHQNFQEAQQASNAKLLKQKTQKSPQHIEAAQKNELTVLEPLQKNIDLFLRENKLNTILTKLSSGSERNSGIQVRLYGKIKDESTLKSLQATLRDVNIPAILQYKGFPVAEPFLIIKPFDNIKIFNEPSFREKFVENIKAKEALSHLQTSLEKKYIPKRNFSTLNALRIAFRGVNREAKVLIAKNLITEINKFFENKTNLEEIKMFLKNSLLKDYYTNKASIYPTRQGKLSTYILDTLEILEPGFSKQAYDKKTKQGNPWNQKKPPSSRSTSRNQ